MRRLARLAALAVLALRAAPAHAEPLDVDLARLGSPDPAVWVAIGGAGYASTATIRSAEAKQRFAMLSSEVALAISSALLQPASTTGHSGFDVSAEATYARVNGGQVGGEVPALGVNAQTWPTTSVVPGALLVSGIHVRKALPFSFEMGGRLANIAMSTAFVAQGEAKWALNEGFDYIPDVAVRAAFTKLFNQRYWNLDTTDLDFMVSKRWGVSGVTSFTPYLAARFAFVNASSERIDFAAASPGGAPAAVTATTAAFPAMKTSLYRTTLGVRMTANAFSAAVEATYFAGKTVSGAASPAADEYPDFQLGATLSAALRLGWEF